MTTRLSRRAAVAVGLSIVAIMVVWAPIAAMANGSAAPATPPGSPAGNAFGLSESGAPGNSAAAPGQTETETTETETTDTTETVTTETVTTETSPPDNSNAGGNSENAGGGNSENAGGGNPNSGDTGSDNGDPAHEGDCDQNDDGTGGAYDANCDGTHQNPGPGNSDNSPGKPADGTVGKADNKNPKGQQPGGNDNNKGYECEPGKTNKGVGKGNPAHTGCTSTPPPCETANGTSLWTLTVTVTDGSASHVSNEYTSLPTNFTITATANTGYNTTGFPGGATTSSYTTTFSNTDCSESFTVDFEEINQPCETANGTSLWTLTVTVTDGSASHSSTTYSSLPTNFTITATAATGYNTTGVSGGPTTSSYTTTFSNTDCAESFTVDFERITQPCPPGTDHAGEFVTPCDDSDPCPPGTDHAGQFVTPCDDSDPCPPGTDHAGQFVSPCDDTDDGEDPCPPGTDHAGEFVSPCNDDDVLGIVLCPDGTSMPPSGQCKEEVLPDFVLGIRLNQDPVAPAVLPSTLNAAPAAVEGAVLPFTGGNVAPFLMTALAMISLGGATLLRSKK